MGTKHSTLWATSMSGLRRAGFSNVQTAAAKTRYWPISDVREWLGKNEQDEHIHAAHVHIHGALIANRAMLRRVSWTFSRNWWAM
jgi:hypothetical protein